MKMAARHWTDEQRAAQSQAIHEWKPWEKSTGAITEQGKAIVSRNAYRGGTRQLCRFARWIFWAIKHPQTLTPEIVEVAKFRCIELCNGFTGWVSIVSEKLIARCDKK
jgi:hypothetical protein